jgi:ABC-type sugar transport system permease subunit
MAAAAPVSRERGVLASLRSRRGRHQAWGYVFLLPMFLLLVVFKFVPMVRALYLSLTSYDLLSPPGSSACGTT